MLRYRYGLVTAIAAVAVLAISPVSTNATTSTEFRSDPYCVSSLPIVNAPAFEIFDRLFDVDVGQVSRQLKQLRSERPADLAPKNVADLARPAYHLRL